MEDVWINFGLSLLFTLVKNPKSVAKYKAALRKLRDALIGLPLDV
jgi:hypothetical protein